MNLYSLGGVSNLIVLVPRYKLSLCHTLIKLDLLGFTGIGVITYGLLDYMIKRFTLYLLLPLCRGGSIGARTGVGRKNGDRCHLLEGDEVWCSGGCCHYVERMVQLTTTRKTC